MFDGDENPFEDKISIKFISDSGLIFKNNNYILKSAYLGRFNGFRDNISFESPWDMISVNMDTFRVYGGSKSGTGVPIGYISWDGEFASLVLQTMYTIDEDKRVIRISRPKNIPYVSLETCPTLIKKMNGCAPYVNVYNAMSSIDFKQLGEVSEEVAKEILSVKTGGRLLKSYWDFDKGIDDIRTEYLVPLLQLIKQFKDSSHLDLERLEAKELYTTLIYRMMDTSIKTQVLAPEAIENMGVTSLGVLFAYIGAQNIGDNLIAHKQPKWFKEIVSPVIREIGITAIHFVDHESKETIEERVNRFLDLEQDLRASIKRICLDSKNQNECLKALN